MLFGDSNELKHKVLQRERVATYRVISRYVLDHATYDIIEGEAANMIVQLVSEVLTERLEPEAYEVTFNPPASWWQHFKATYRGKWWLRWFVNRKPVVRATLKKTVVFESKRSYPNADINVHPGPLGRPVIVETVSESNWSPVLDPASE